jgi:phenylacetic acid degradation operon negative regulatory protein
LNLARVTPQRSLSIRQLIAIGGLFGLNANAMRVAVTRLTAEGLLESDERGSYRLGPAAAAMHEHVEEWRRGEARVRPWKGDFVAVSLPAATARAERRASLRALARLGLREALPGIWIRPDNLRLALDATHERLSALGLEEGSELFRARDFSERLAARFAAELWPLRGLQRSYESAQRNLERSLEQLAGMPRETALVQSYLLGGEAIRVLATDPLLPEQIMPTEPRARLTETMLRYDAVGHALWKDFAARSALAVLKGGRRAG